MGIAIRIGGLAVGSSGGSSWTAQKYFNRGKVVFSFDETWASQYTTAFPYFVSKGIKATFYVTYDFIGTAGRMTWANLLEMHNAGMDIECHSQTHADFTTLSDAQIKAELNYQNAAFIANGLPSPRHFAYPTGPYNNLTKASVSILRDTARTINGFTPIYGDSDKQSLCSPSNDHPELNTIAEIESWMDAVKINNTALILHGHNVINGDAPYTISLAKLTTLVEYAISIGIDVISIKQLYALMVKGAVVNDDIALSLTKTGDGTGISKIMIQPYEDISITLDGTAKFYTDAAGTVGESSVWNMQPIMNTIYLRCPSGVSNFVISRNKINKWEEWTSGINAASLGGNMDGLNQMSRIKMWSTNSLSFDVSKFSLLSYFDMAMGSGAIGSLSDLTELDYVTMSGGHNIIMPRAINTKKICDLSFGSTALILLTTANVNQLLADFWANKDVAKNPLRNATRVLALTARSGSGAPSGQGITDKAALQAYRSPNNDGAYALWTVTTS